MARSIETGIALIVGAAVALIGGEAWAGPSPRDATGGAVAVDLESGGTGCFDPLSWVWQAPRAERVAVEVPSNVPCEIGSPGCQRRAESAMLDDTSMDDAEQVCAMKMAQHERGEHARQFDGKSCLEAERVLLSLDFDPPAPDPWAALSCHEEDPECQSMPPVPEKTSPVSTTPQALVRRPPPTLELAPSIDLVWWLGQSRAGVRRRIERPPEQTSV